MNYVRMWNELKIKLVKESLNNPYYAVIYEHMLLMEKVEIHAKEIKEHGLKE